jgi:hypothetical protein
MCDLAEAVMDFHAHRLFATKPILTRSKLASPPLGPGFDVFDAVRRAAFLELEMLVQVLPRQQRGRTGAESRAELLDRDLVEVGS